MTGAWLLSWLLLLGSPGYPVASIHPYFPQKRTCIFPVSSLIVKPGTVECIFGNFTKDFIQVFYGNTKQDLSFPFNLAEYLPDAFHPGPDFYGIPWKSVYVGIALLAIFIWSFVLAVKAQIYQVNLQQILLMTKNCIEENTKLLEKLSNLEKKINESKTCIQETKWKNNILSDEVNKFKAQTTAEVGLKQLIRQLSASVSTERRLQEYKKELEDDCRFLRSRRAAKEAECKTLRLKVEILEEMLGQQRMAAKEKLEQKVRKRQECWSQLSEEEEKAKMVEEEVRKYMHRIREMEHKLQQIQSFYRQQIAFCEEKAHNSWLRAYNLEREFVEQTRKTADLKYRLEIIQRKKAQGEGDMLWRTDVDELPQRDLGPGAAPRRYGDPKSSFPAKQTEEGKQTPPQEPEGDSSPSLSPLEAPLAAVDMAAQWPPPFPGLPVMHHPMGDPALLMLMYGPPPPPWEPFGPPPLPPPPPFGRYSDF